MSFNSGIGSSDGEVGELSEQFSNIGLAQADNIAVSEALAAANYQNPGIVNYDDRRWNYLPETTREIIAALVHFPSLFILYALDERRTFAVQQLIKQAKYTAAVAPLVTRTLSAEFYQVMTHRIGKHVVRQCLASIDAVYNEVLFEKAIQYYLDLATDPEGCISLNECINYISGPFRLKLLLVIADKAAYLSYDPHGNFVVQHVLSVNNEYVNEIICNNLRGQYVQLSSMERGSHVVERCISCSIHGMRLAVEELTKKDKLLCHITCNKYGNYVVQAALEATRVHDLDLYKCLLQELTKNLQFIDRSRYAKKVIFMVLSSKGWLSGSQRPTEFW
jgi:hypothetical protein